MCSLYQGKVWSSGCCVRYIKVKFGLLTDCVRYIRVKFGLMADCVISGWFWFGLPTLLADCVRYFGDVVRSGSFAIHFSVTLAGLKNIVCFSEDFVIKGFVLSSSTVPSDTEIHLLEHRGLLENKDPVYI